MKKILFTIVAIISIGSTAVAQSLETGYRGFFDVDYVLSCTSISVGRYEEDLSSRIGATTTHGYQFNPYLFAGIGAGYQNFYEGNAYCIPTFADLQVIMPTRVAPFIDAKIGYSFGDFKGLYFNPSVGVRFGLTEKFGLNIGAGYLMQTLEDVDGLSGDITFKIGFDF